MAPWPTPKCIPALAAPEVVILTTSGAASDENFVKMTTFPFSEMVLLIASFGYFESYNNTATVFVLLSLLRKN